jgi:glutamate-1-semialdehyde 2,1-aminomutase
MTGADDLLAYGGQHKLLQRPLQEDEQAVFPELAESAQGCELIDSTGRSFVDWFNGGGPVILGYRHPAVEAAIEAQLAAGPTMSLMHRVELEVAAMLTEMIPCAEMVAFGKNGSDVITAAIRVARAVTGRELILQHGFHGFHDWYVCMSDDVAGVPAVLESLVHQFPYNDLGRLEELFDRFGDEVAAIVMDPVDTQLPEPGYLEGVRDMAHRHGALVVFDEMVTGFRLANGGAQEHFGVTPDLATFGKALANGMPLSAVVGKREYMCHLPRTAYGMTFRGETLSLAAARAVLEVIRDEPVTEHLARIGSEVRDAFHAACAARGVNCMLIGPPSRMTFAFVDQMSVPRESLELIFTRECARNGVLTNGTLLPSYAHNDEAVRRTVAGFEVALQSVADVVQEATDAVGAAIQVGFALNGLDSEADAGGGLPVPNGSIEVMREEGEELTVTGWLLLPEGCPDAIDFVARSGRTRPAARVERADLASAFPKVGDAAAAGYTVSLPAATFAEDDVYDFRIRARHADRTVFRCRVVRSRERSRLPKLHVPHWSTERVLYA